MSLSAAVVTQHSCGFDGRAWCPECEPGRRPTYSGQRPVPSPSPPMTDVGHLAHEE